MVLELSADALQTEGVDGFRQRERPDRLSLPAAGVQTLKVMT